MNFTTGKIQSVTNTKGGETIIEMDSEYAAKWMSNTSNQGKICKKTDRNIKFHPRTFNIIALNAPLTIDPNEENHGIEICKANNLQPDTIITIKWVKPIDKRSPNQRTAHLLLTVNSANAANRAITNRLNICNRRCQVEKTR